MPRRTGVAMNLAAAWGCNLHNSSRREPAAQPRDGLGAAVTGAGAATAPRHGPAQPGTALPAPPGPQAAPGPAGSSPPAALAPRDPRPERAAAARLCPRSPGSRPSAPAPAAPPAPAAAPAVPGAAPRPRAGARRKRKGNAVRLPRSERSLLPAGLPRPVPGRAGRARRRCSRPSPAAPEPAAPLGAAAAGAPHRGQPAHQARTGAGRRRCRPQVSAAAAPGPRPRPGTHPLGLRSPFLKITSASARGRVEVKPISPARKS